MSLRPQCLCYQLSVSCWLALHHCAFACLLYRDLLVSCAIYASRKRAHLHSPRPISPLLLRPPRSGRPLPRPVLSLPRPPPPRPREPLDDSPRADCDAPALLSPLAAVAGLSTWETVGSAIISTERKFACRRCNDWHYFSLDLEIPRSYLVWV